MKSESINYSAVVAGMDNLSIDELLLLLAGENLEITRPPQAGLVMMTVTDSFGTDFHLGEILVTEAGVSLNETEGYGTVMGENPRKALAAASVDALIRSTSPTGLREAVLEIIRTEKSCQMKRNAEDAALTATSRVSFDLMSGA